MADGEPAAAAINKLLGELLGADLKLSAEVRDMFAESCTEFVQLISSEASELSDKEKKTTIMPEHVLAALESLGFGEFSADLQCALEAWKAEDKAATSSRSKLKGKGGGMSEEEAEAAQQALFAAARARVWGGAEAGAPP